MSLRGVYRSVSLRTRGLSAILNTALEVAPGVVFLPYLLIGEFLIIAGVLATLPLIYGAKAVILASVFAADILSTTWSVVLESVLFVRRTLLAQVVWVRVDATVAFLDPSSGGNPSVSSVETEIRYVFSPPLTHLVHFFRRLALEETSGGDEPKKLANGKEGRVGKFRSPDTLDYVMKP